MIMIISYMFLKGLFNFNLSLVFKCNIRLFLDLKYTRETCSSVNEFAPHLCYRFYIVTCLDYKYLLSATSCSEGIVVLSPEAKGQARVVQK